MSLKIIGKVLKITTHKKTAGNMDFARCGVEGNLRKVSENTRKKLFHFLVFS